MVHIYNKYEMISLHALETHTCCRNSIVAPIECIDVLIALGHMTMLNCAIDLHRMAQLNTCTRGCVFSCLMV